MLGAGRPFVFEVIGARNPGADLASLDARIAQSCVGRVELAPLAPVPRARVAHWKEGRFAKLYRVKVSLDGEVDEAKLRALVGRDIDVSQRTPFRVAYRRADITRDRAVTVVAAVAPQARTLDLDLRCEHGTYVKEWVSGDDGRTLPSLTTLLGVGCICVELDVLEILTSTSDHLDASPPQSTPS
jgi:tRNA pseudouridine synthase 10